VAIMKTIGLFSVLATPDVAASREFYERFFGMRAAFVSDWYVQLIHPGIPSLQLGLIVRGHESMPAPGQVPNGAVIVTIEVGDVDSMYRILTESNAAVRSQPRDEAWGQRHFFVQDPAGYWIDIVQPIALSAEYSAAYTDIS
jgi:catechol 2,3-dioxygenase-like lactoylglutathione lyase family enzyme